MKQQTKFKKTEIGMIPEDWKVDILDHFLNLITYGFTCPMPTTEKGPFMITAKDLECNKINFDSARRTSEDAFNNKLTDKSRPIKNDILLSKDGTLGRVAVVEDENLCISQSVALLRPSEKISPMFLYYLLITPQYQKKMESDAEGSVLKHIYITRVNKMVVAIPQLTEQSVIAKILSSLDDKIALNRQMNSTLEATGLALFKHWFVDFEFPNDEGKPYKSNGGELVDSGTDFGDVPKGWVVKPIDEIAEFLNGLALQKHPPKDENFLPVIKIRELKQGTTESSDKASPDINKKYIVENGDILFSWSGSLEVRIWCGGRGALNQHLFKVTSQDYPKWFYYQWIKVYLPEFRHVAEGKATTMGHIQRHHLSGSFVAVPPRDVLENTDKILNSLIERYINNAVEARNLSKIRDALLPKLMSGEIQVPVEVGT